MTTHLKIPVLKADEATSLLDTTSRILVFEAIKLWQQNVITHDLPQITPEDFVYLPVKEVEDEKANDGGDSPSLEQDPETHSQRSHPVPAHLKHQSIAICSLTLGNWMFDVVVDLASTQVPSAAVTTQQPLSWLTFSPYTTLQLQIIIPSDRA
ncbi:hypothetical protein K443DRAFT_13632 [Laccaria amethystina LaAM-08-1]|uniref:Uncharacterized protein n=1 Tax=Laccaria amethystina LaAM-08-1 TaxID=1095629 RepID=A0A0C9X403_9AGAR|nr:hypothetical protein K443DRAFT_13632 [Laccaria amethystina LaAM-08-1]